MMAQYFEVLSQGDNNVEQCGQFFNGNQENQQTQVRYILADDSQQFQTQQVMVVDGTPQQIQELVIDQGQITYQSSSQQQQFSVVQNRILNNQPPQQVYYMEANSAQTSENIRTVQTIIQQSSPVQQGTQLVTQTSPLVINQVGSASPNLIGARQVVQGTQQQRPVLHIRPPIRPGHIQINPQSRTMSGPIRQTIPQQVRPLQESSPQLRSINPQQMQMRIRAPLNQVRQPVQQMSQRPVINSQQKSSMISMNNRQLSALQKQPIPQNVQQQGQSQQQQTQVGQQQQPQQSIQLSKSGAQLNLSQQKGINTFQGHQQQPKSNDEELDDHDPSMNSTPGHMANYKKFLEVRQQLGKNPILARLPSNIKVTPTGTNSTQQAQPQQCSITQTIDEVINQQLIREQSPVQQQPPQNPVGGTQQVAASENPNVNQNVQMAQKKPRAPPRPPPKNPNISPPAVGPRARLQSRPTSSPQVFPAARLIGPQQQTPRFPMNQQQPRFPNQQSMLQQHMAHPTPQRNPPSAPQQQPPPPPPPQQHPPVAQQPNGNNQSQMNYLITPPAPNRPRQQRPLPPYIPSSQIQQIIESTPIADEFSDSIRMLVLLENGEQRLITFTLPKEACTIQEILEQVNVPFTLETNIQVTEANTNGINYIVTVGNVGNIAYGSNEEDSQEATSTDTQATPPMSQNRPTQQPHDPYQGKSLGPDQGLVNRQPSEPTKPASPEPPKETSPKLIAGKLAVCFACGYTGEDFNRCARCSRKLPENVKSIDAASKIDIFGTKQSPNQNSMSPSKSDVGAKSPSKSKQKISKSKIIENESVVISSDEEDEEKETVKSVSEQLLRSLGASISISPITKEPSFTDIKKHVRKLNTEDQEYVKVDLACRTVRIGSYRFVPVGDVIIDTKCLIIKAPVTDNKNEIKTLRIDRGDIVKVLVCFNKQLPVAFYYLNVGAAPIIRDMLNLRRETGLYYDPVDEKEDSYRKITLLPEDFEDNHKSLFLQLYGINTHNIMDELTAKEANDILIKTCPKDTISSTIGSFSEIKQILLYPKEGQGRLSINTEDYVCLAIDQFLNDKIIDFYLKYLWENLPAEKQKKVHIFSTFFYKRLTTKPTKAARKSHPFESDPLLSAAEKRHCRVKNWTKRINLFEKDFIVVPINENAHWFLAIICFPSMRGPQTFDGKPFKPEPKEKIVKKKSDVKKEKPIPCDDPMLSDKDEAESEDSDLESDESEEMASNSVAAPPTSPATSPVTSPSILQSKSKSGTRVPIKQPCILIFDSLAGPSRSRVVATLRDYLTIEYKSKMESERVYNRDVIKGASCKVPQQNNFTDCGLYLLQYVEQFFKDPIKDYNIPIKGINNWFEEITVTRKREDICNLIKKLMEEAGTDTSMLPDIALPTLEGNLVERQDADRENDAGDEEQEDMFTDIEDSEMADTSDLNTSKTSEENGDPKLDETQENLSMTENSQNESQKSLLFRPSVEGISEKTDIVSTATEPLLKPTLSEFPIPRQTTNKDTLNYLKSKRIVRHKPPSEEPELKKTKFDN